MPLCLASKLVGRARDGGGRVTSPLAMRVHPTPQKRDIAVQSCAAATATAGAGEKKLRCLPHIVSKMPELPFVTDADISRTTPRRSAAKGLQASERLLNSLQPRELIAIEEALQNGQTNLRDKQMDHWRMHRRNGKMLEDEHKLLAFRMHQQDVELSGGMRELEIGYHHDREFTSQMPFTFRVQPSHPNLQENE
ncbi:MADS-box transcription factor 4-like [Phragmites australis]|uniref:MADS-box transcription factor 4-like n=1 Tax=Phragmites australis TaxID=29695 RepID=UPI002D79BBB8|nr:MADS-box transcription factor 4-like [Phragmites australis]